MISDFKFLTKNSNIFKHTPFNQGDVDNMVEYFNQVADSDFTDTVRRFPNGTYFFIDDMTGTFTMGGISNDDRLVVRGQLTYHFHYGWKMIVTMNDRVCTYIQINFSPPTTPL